MSGGRITFPSKKSGETVGVVFEFLSSMGATTVESIVTRSVVASVYSGIDANPSAIISGAATAPSSTSARQLITAGIPGVIYSLLCTVTTNQAQTLQQVGLLAVEMNVSGAP